jgi:hypothetical protein
MVFKKTVQVAFLVAIAVSIINGQVDSNFHCYLLFGQSNMAGGGAGVSIGGSGAGTIIAADCDTSPRVRVLAFCDCPTSGSGTWTSSACSQYKKSRVHDQWYTAYPALHICDEGVSPGDWFAKTLLDSVREDIKIGLIPCALSGQALKVFEKGGSGFNLPTWAHPTLGNNSPYTWMVNRCQIAQQTGVIKGILLHQGESGSGAGSWVTMAIGILNNLKTDLGLPSTLPVVVGELRADQYASFNTGSVGQLAKQYANCAVASSAGCSVQSDDTWHFDAAGMRELGKRFAKAFLSLASNQFVPRKGTSKIVDRGHEKYPDLQSAKVGIRVYSLNGRMVGSYSGTDAGVAFRGLNGGGVYIVSCKLNNGRPAIVPFIRE